MVLLPCQDTCAFQNLLLPGAKQCLLPCLRYGIFYNQGYCTDFCFLCSVWIQFASFQFTCFCYWIDCHPPLGMYVCITVFIELIVTCIRHAYLTALGFCLLFFEGFLKILFLLILVSLPCTLSWFCVWFLFVLVFLLLMLLFCGFCGFVFVFFLFPNGL